MADIPPRPRGARLSPRHRLAAATPHRPLAVPPTFAVIPPKLSIWGNSTHGDCVTAEEAFAKAAFSLMGGRTQELFYSDQEVVDWASAHGFLEGADLTSVMDAMARDGMKAPNGKTYYDGTAHTVDWTQDSVLSSAIYTGPVKIAVAANQLENVVAQHNGWTAVNFNKDTAYDHCVSLCGYGSLAQLCGLFSRPVPAGKDPATRAYLLFTWGTVGIIARPSMIAITGEAWVRLPTTPGLPTPTPTPPPVATSVTVDWTAKTVSGSGWTVHSDPSVGGVHMHPSGVANCPPGWKVG